MKLTEPLSGIIPPMITPLKDQDTLDTGGLNRLLNHLLSGGVHGLFILGTTGESPSLSYDLRYELTERVCKQVEKRVPVLVGISDSSVTESLRLADKAAEWGAVAVVATPPYYYMPTQQDLKKYFRFLADALPLPLFLYNIPSHTKVNLEPDTIKELADHQNIIGLKDSSADLIYFQKVAHLVKEKQEFSLLTGPEEILMQTVLLGGHGGVNGGANMFPRLYVDMYDAAKQRNFDRMIPLQECIIQISSKVYTVGSSEYGVIQGVKCVLSLINVCNDYMATPLSALSKGKRKIIEHYLKEFYPPVTL